MRRWTLFALGLTLSLAVTTGLWMAGIKGAALLLLFPFLWLPFSRGASPPNPRTCPTCGHAALDPDDRFCPRDGTPLD